MISLFFSSRTSFSIHTPVFGGCEMPSGGGAQEKCLTGDTLRTAQMEQQLQEASLRRTEAMLGGYTGNAQEFFSSRDGKDIFDSAHTHFNKLSFESIAKLIQLIWEYVVSKGYTLDPAGAALDKGTDINGNEGFSVNLINASGKKLRATVGHDLKD